MRTEGMTKFNVGDKVRILDKSGIMFGYDLTNGKEYEVTEIHENVVSVIDDAEDQLSILESEYHAIELVKEDVNMGRANTKFKVGDKVRYISEGWFEEGAVLYIVEYDGGTVMPYSLSPNPGDGSGSVDALWVNEEEFELVKEDVNMRRVNTEYKTEKRKAYIGERILITDAVSTFGEYDNGDIYTVEKYFYGVSSEGVNVRELPKDCEGHSLQIYDREYEVIVEEPTQASSHNENLVLTRLFNAEAEVDKLTRSIDELKRKVETLEVAQEKEKADKPMYSLSELIGKITDGNSHIPKPKTPTRTANQRRADVNKRAEAFVEDLRERAYGTNANRDGNYLFNEEGTRLEFHVNAKKRTVVALAKYRDSNGIRGKAFARCAPGDVFNDKIGMAIAAGRLYGVEIPEEFLDAPQPTEVVVGMRVDNTFRHAKELGWGVGRVTDIDRNYVNNSMRGYSVDDRSWSFLESVVILDDSEAVYE